MQKHMVYHLNNQLFDIFQQEIKELHQDVRVITMEKFNMELYYEDLISDEKEEKQALLLEIQELKEKLHKAEAKNQGQVSGDETMCCPTTQELHLALKEREKTHLQEIEMLTIEFEIDVAVAQKEVDKLQKELQNERKLGAKSDLGTREAIEITNNISNKIEVFGKVSREQSAEIKVQDENILYLDFQQLQEMLQRERNLRVKAEKENLDQFKSAEIFIEMMDQELKTEQELRAQIEADKQEAIEIAEKLIEKIEDLEKMSKEGPTEISLDDQDKIQQEIQQLEKMLQKEKALRIQAETCFEIMDQELKTEQELRVQIEADKQEVVEIADKLLKKLEDLEKMSKEGPAEITLDEREKIKQLEKMLQEEKTLRVQAETEKANLLKIVKSFSQEIDKELQKERALRKEAERGKLKIEKFSKKLFQGLKKARKMTETLSAETKVLTNKLQAEHKKQEALVKDVQELTLMLDKETALRLQAENYEMEAMEIVEALKKEATCQNKDLKGSTTS